MLLYNTHTHFLIIKFQQENRASCNKILSNLFSAIFLWKPFLFNFTCFSHKSSRRMKSIELDLEETLNLTHSTICRNATFKKFRSLTLEANS